MASETKNLNKLTKNLGGYLDQDQLEQVKKAYFFATSLIASYLPDGPPWPVFISVNK